MTAAQKSIEERLAAVEASMAAVPKATEELVNKLAIGPVVEGLVDRLVTGKLVEMLTDKQSESIVLKGLKSLCKELVLLPLDAAKGLYMAVKDMCAKPAPTAATPVVEPVAGPAAEPAKA